MPNKKTALALSFSAVALLGGCSASSGSGAVPLSMSSMERSWRVGADSGSAGSVYVTDTASDTVDTFANGTWSQTGDISKGVSAPNADNVDAKGNLYVANEGTANIVEYKAGGTSPSFYYKSHMTNPVNVTIDSKGNVYEADYNGGYVNEYAQGKDTVLYSCAPGPVEGVAIDTSGDVFVAYNVKPKAQIVEYKGGLSGCKGTVLGAEFDFVGGIALDKDANLIVCDQDAGKVDLVKPPYAKVSRGIGKGFKDPLHVTLNAANTYLFLIDYARSEALVLNYPSGSEVTKLAGLTSPTGAVDSSNAVY